MKDVEDEEVDGEDTACPYSDDGNHNWHSAGTANDGTTFSRCSDCGLEVES